jgi:pilus assembly protein FimV
VLSAIGQPFVGEIELVSVSKEELSSLAARLGAPDAYRGANIQYNPALTGARATIERRPNGQPYVRITSTRAVEEPYIDLLVELTWNTGRIVREFTALVDPPGFAAPQQAAPAVVPEVRPAPAKPAAAAPAPRTPAPADAGGKTYGPVQPGDTLRKIASGVRPEGVNLDQVLVGIFRSNPDAFINNNMNLLRAGKILKIPDASELSQLSGGEAEKEVRVQTADWNAYRQRVAGAAPETPPGDARVAAGRIVPKVEETAPPPAPGKEVVKVSKGAPGKDAPGADKGVQDRVRVLEEEAAVREKTLKDSGEKIAALEKTIKDMQRLLELKGAAPPPAPTDAKAPAKPPVDVAKPDATPAPAVKAPVAEVKPEPAPAPKPPAVEVKPEPKPEPKQQAKPVTPPPPPPPAPQWWEDPTLLGGGIAALGLLGGVGYMLARRRRQQEGAPEPELEPRLVPAAAPAAAAAAAPSVVAKTFEPDATTQMPAVAQPAPVDDVDPIAEADVYIAYGRDAQAEEILREAMAKNPGRSEIKLKLLEIYAARKSKTDFNPLAQQLHDTTRGAGDTWMRAAAMGFALDPENALYAAGKDSTIIQPIGMQTDVNLDFDLDMVSTTGAPSTSTDLTLDAGTDQVEKTMVLSPERMEQLRAEGASQARDAGASSAVPALDLTLDTVAVPKTDITLEAPAPAGPITDINLDLPAPTTASNVIDFEFDPGKTVPAGTPTAANDEQTIALTPENQAKARDLGVEIDLGALGAPDVTAPQIPPEATAEIPAAAPTADISFDFKIPEPAPPTVAETAVPPTDVKLDVPAFKPADTATMDFALDTVSFDLGSGTIHKPAAPAEPAHDDHWYDVQTKFDLAKAYQEMGDKDGAREILSEVLTEGDAKQQAEAKELLAKLS